MWSEYSGLDTFMVPTFLRALLQQWQLLLAAPSGRNILVAMEDVGIAARNDENPFFIYIK